MLGRRLVTQLVARGTEVVGLARTPAAASLIRSLGGRPAQVGLFESGLLARAMKGVDVVVHAATAIPPGLRARLRSAWAANDRIRRDGTRALATAAAAAGARQYLQQSVAWVVKSPRGERFYDEDVPPDPPVLVRSAVDGERIAREIGRRHGLRVGILRGGTFYGPDASRPMAPLIRRGRMPIPGRGDGLIAPIHVDDMASAFVLAAQSGAEGTWHVVDDERVTLARLLQRLADVMGAPEPPRIPMWWARLLLGRHVVESLTTSMNTSNAKLRRELGWTPSFPTYREGIAQLVAVWRHENLLSPAATAA